MLHKCKENYCKSKKPVRVPQFDDDGNKILDENGKHKTKLNLISSKVVQILNLNVTDSLCSVRVTIFV